MSLEADQIVITLFNIKQLEQCLELLKIKCLEPIMDNNSNLEENRELFTSFLFIKDSFKTLDILQLLIKDKC